MKKCIPIIFLLAVFAACGSNARKAPESKQSGPAEQDISAPSYAGTVVSTKDASNYTYLEIKGKDGVFWAAVPRTKVTVNDAVELINPSLMQNFEAKALGRKFATIIFAAAAVVNGKVQPPLEAKAPANTKTPQQEKDPVVDASQHMTSNTAVDASDVKKADGGVAIAEVLAAPANFKDKKVLMRAKVTKFLPEIMKKNWLHLKDASVKDKDIVATTQENFKVGEVVLIEGTVRTAQDFGFGYKYDVLIEEVKSKGK